MSCSSSYPKTGATHRKKACMTDPAGLERRFDVIDGFFRRPRGMTFVEVADIDVDSDDNVYVFTRSAHPVMIFDRHGELLDSWGGVGRQQFVVPHGLVVGPDGCVYTVDVGMHVVRKWSVDGRLLLTIGIPFQNAPEHSGLPFNKPSNVAVTADGDIYVSDGYGNSRVHCFSPDGELRFSFGSRGRRPAQFDLVHGISIDRVDGQRLYVADRYNNRIQALTLDGVFVDEWTELHLPNCAVRAADGLLYVAEQRHRVSVFDGHRLVARWGDEGVPLDDVDVGGGLPDSPSRNPMLRGVAAVDPGSGRFMLPHSIAVDSTGAVYVGEVAETLAGVDRGDRAIQRFEPRVEASDAPARDDSPPRPS
jgi:DNA-binding beta-propeller fold protein YncE